jgi:hypothetical protein
VAVDEAENVCAARYVRGLVQIGIQLGRGGNASGGCAR